MARPSPIYIQRGNLLLRTEQPKFCKLFTNLTIQILSHFYCYINSPSIQIYGRKFVNILPPNFYTSKSEEKKKRCHDIKERIRKVLIYQCKIQGAHRRSAKPRTEARLSATKESARMAAWFHRSPALKLIDLLLFVRVQLYVYISHVHFNVRRARIYVCVSIIYRERERSNRGRSVQVLLLLIIEHVRNGLSQRTSDYATRIGVCVRVRSDSSRLYFRDIKTQLSCVRRRRWLWMC